MTDKGVIEFEGINRIIQGKKANKTFFSSFSILDKT